MCFVKTITAFFFFLYIYHEFVYKVSFSFYQNNSSLYKSYVLYVLPWCIYSFVKAIQFFKGKTFAFINFRNVSRISFVLHP